MTFIVTNPTIKITGPNQALLCPKCKSKLPPRIKGKQVRCSKCGCFLGNTK